MLKIFKNIILMNFLTVLIKRDLIKYPTSKNLTYFWNFGSLAGLFLSIQLVTGILLTFHYIGDINTAFNCVELLMKDLDFGWFLRYIHSNGASFFFITIYIHIIKALHYNSFLYPRHILWSSGIIIFILSMGAAFLGYLLPWGQMSYWAATVITNLITVLPYFGKDLVYWVWGGYNINYYSLSRFYSLHFLLPFLITIMVVYHLYELHVVGSSNYLSNSLLSIDKINFFPYFVIKDLFGLLLLLNIFLFVYSFNPEYLAHPDNYIKANPLVTPSHIVPEWYFLPYYAVLRSILDKLYGIIFMGLSIFGLLLLPFITDKYIKNNSFSFFDYVISLSLLVNFILLGNLGIAFPISPFIEIGCIASHSLLLFYFLIIPFNCLNNFVIFRMEKTNDAFKNDLKDIEENDNKEDDNIENDNKEDDNIKNDNKENDNIENDNKEDDNIKNDNKEDDNKLFKEYLKGKFIVDYIRRTNFFVIMFLGYSGGIIIYFIFYGFHLEQAKHFFIDNYFGLRKFCELFGFVENNDYDDADANYDYDYNDNNNDNNGNNDNGVMTDEIINKIDNNIDEIINKMGKDFETNENKHPVKERLKSFVENFSVSKNRDKYDEFYRKEILVMKRLLEHSESLNDMFEKSLTYNRFINEESKTFMLLKYIFDGLEHGYYYFLENLMNILVFFHFVLPMTIRMYGMILLLIQVKLVILMIFLLVFSLICFIVENYNSCYKQVREPYTESMEGIFDVMFIVGSSVVISNILSLSLSQLYSADIINTFFFDIGINVTGNQWYWTYSYKDAFNFFNRLNFDYFSVKKIKESENLIINLISNLSLVVNFNRLLVCDYALLIPVDVWIGTNIASNDVIHSWALPNFGIKQDAIPGKQILQVFRSEILGITFGQCSELCGTNHAFMPINIFILHQELFLIWYSTMIGTSNIDVSYHLMLHSIINFEIK